MSGRPRGRKSNICKYNKSNSKCRVQLVAAAEQERDRAVSECLGYRHATEELTGKLDEKKGELAAALRSAQEATAKLVTAQQTLAQQTAALNARPPDPQGTWGGEVTPGRKSQQRSALMERFGRYFENDSVLKDRIAEVVENDPDIRERVATQQWVKKRTGVKAQQVLDELQDHYNHIGLAVKHIVGISWGKYLTLRRIMSYEFEEPEDLTFSTDDDIGEYMHLEMITLEGAKLPVLPSYYKLRKEEDTIVEKNGGYKISRDGKAGFRDLMPALTAVCEKEKVKLQTSIGSGGKLVVQLFGDGFNMFRCGKYVNMCLRVCGAHFLEGSALSCDTLAVWAGGDTYDDVRSRCEELLNDIAKLLKGKQVHTSWGWVPVMAVGGGDALWINDIMGLSGFACKCKCNYCEQSSDDFGDLNKNGVMRTYVRACHAAHMPSSDQDFPFECPFCTEKVNGKQVPLKFTKERWEAHHKVVRTESQLKIHARGHAGQQHSKTPLFRGMDHSEHPECVLHLLIAIAGTMYKHAVMINVKEIDVATAMNNFIHQTLHIYIRPVKVVPDMEVQDLIKKPSFVGGEAKKAIEHLSDLLKIVNNGEPLTALQDKQLEARDQFFKVYNRIAERLEDPQNPQERDAKARAVQTLLTGDGLTVESLHDSFFYKYKKAFGSGPAVTYYVHTLVKHLTQHIRDIPADIMTLSGQGLEHCNKLRKADGVLTNKRHFTHDDLTIVGKRKRGVMQQLLTMDLVRKHMVCSEYKQRASYYERTVKRVGRTMNELEKKELDL
jgi:hypothetical protein